MPREQAPSRLPGIQANPGCKWWVLNKPPANTQSICLLAGAACKYEPLPAEKRTVRNSSRCSGVSLKVMHGCEITQPEVRHMCAAPRRFWPWRSSSQPLSKSACSVVRGVGAWIAVTAISRSLRCGARRQKQCTTRADASSRADTGLAEQPPHALLDSGVRAVVWLSTPFSLAFILSTRF